MIAQEHHGLSAAFMTDIHHFLSYLGHFPSLESLEILEFPGRNAVLVIVIALIDDIFRTERIACFLFKLLQDIRAYRCGIAIPVHVLFSRQFVEHQGELVEKGGEPEHINIRMILNELPQTLHRIFMGFRLSHIKGDLMLHILPVIYNGIVHVNRIPHNISKKAHRIIMERNTLDFHFSCGLIIRPVPCGHHLSGAPVNHFPPAPDIIPAVRCEHIRIQAFHETDPENLPVRRVNRRHYIHLLDFIRIGLRPVIIFSGGIIGGIYL